MREEMKFLHLVRSLEEERAYSLMRQQQERGDEITLVLLGDAVLKKVPLQGKILSCKADVAARGGKTTYPTIDYDEIVRLIFQADRVISW